MSETLVKDLEKLLRRKMAPVFKRYGIEIESLLTPLKWQPLVLVIGNYSSGKSTFINELLGMPVQRTGQAPTDDSFTIIAGRASGDAVVEVPGSTVVSDEQMPFAPLRRFGEHLVAHLRLKRVDAPILKELALIDTPGMLDSVTEKDRGYDYLGVVNELARMADLIILMFDPHKAGTIKETYQAIRSTLPGATGEDRVLYVLNRIDECENITDLVHSYGTLCWNLSQMTGRKDIPRIFLTYAPGEAAVSSGVEAWLSEREELKQAVKAAPRQRMTHLLQEVDRGLRELALLAEAMAAYKKGFNERFLNVLRVGGFAALLVFFFGDLLTKHFLGMPDTVLLAALADGTLGRQHLIGPLVGVLLVLVCMSMFVQRWLIPSYIRRSLAALDRLLPLETAYKQDLWERVRSQVQQCIATQGRRHLRTSHNRNVRRVQRFVAGDLRRLYERIKPG